MKSAKPARPAKPVSVPAAELQQLRADRDRLDFLIDWFGRHDDFEGSGVRDWDDNADAREAIDAARLTLVAAPAEPKEGR